ncbi:homoserine dehydrogenase [Desulfacinum hydrothermale DSM 13146]|uniref:Homoserine dehydrogenase n=1 Tax=Desulfacinum hydrothermale DSM 13146 TaxID=1121390 RepID=A0A1W1XD10_9BACT|nr:homoserine dehydrogenase [Desulfacinum hydrothermale]SMC21538.1 homoserine dehydrogenase [Desulfacinum hydrothermale DSM 13146]
MMGSGQRNILLLGFGNVGRAFARLVAEKRDELAGRYGVSFGFSAIVDIGGAVVDPAGTLPVLDIHRHVAAGKALEEFPELGRPGLGALEAIRTVPCDVMVEATPTCLRDGEPARTHVLEGLRAGCHVISANKGPFIWAYDTIMEAAMERGLAVGLSAATAAALPTLDVAELCLAGSRILSVEGILNGTTNYILTRMHQTGCAYEDGLGEAQRLGIAETDPRLDVEGWDTANKLILIANRVFHAGLTPRDVAVQGITSVTPERIRRARDEGRVIKLIGRIAPSSHPVRVSVGPEALPGDHPLAAVSGSEKAVSFETDSMGRITVSGGHSSPLGAAAALLKDALRIALYHDRSLSRSSKASSNP